MIVVTIEYCDAVWYTSQQQLQHNSKGDAVGWVMLSSAASSLIETLSWLIDEQPCQLSCSILLFLIDPVPLSTHPGP